MTKKTALTESNLYQLTQLTDQGRQPDSIFTPTASCERSYHSEDQPLEEQIEECKRRLRISMETLLRLEPEGRDMLDKDHLELDRQNRVCFKKGSDQVYLAGHLEFWKTKVDNFQSYILSVQIKKRESLSCFESSTNNDESEQRKRWPKRREGIEQWVHNIGQVNNSKRRTTGRSRGSVRRSRRLAGLSPEFTGVAPTRRRRARALDPLAT